MATTRLLVTAAALGLVACATTGNTPQQDRTYAAWAKCQAAGHDARGSVKLDRVEPDGRPQFWMTGDGMAGWQEVRQCMAEQMVKIPLPPSLKVSSASTQMAGLVVPEPPAWVKGDEWEFRSESPTGRSTFKWTVDRLVVMDGVAHYVIKTGSREIFYRERGDSERSRGRAMDSPESRLRLAVVGGTVLGANVSAGETSGQEGVRPRRHRDRRSGGGDYRSSRNIQDVEDRPSLQDHGGNLLRRVVCAGRSDVGSGTRPPRGRPAPSRVDRVSSGQPDGGSAVTVGEKFVALA